MGNSGISKVLAYGQPSSSFCIATSISLSRSLSRRAGLFSAISLAGLIKKVKEKAGDEKKHYGFLARSEEEVVLKLEGAEREGR